MFHTLSIRENRNKVQYSRQNATSSHFARVVLAEKGWMSNAT